MAEINFRNLISTETGVGATTGRETAKFFNENFRITKENLEAIWSVLQDMVGSKNIEGIRVKPYLNSDSEEDEVLGYYLEFTDNPDLTVEEDYQPLSIRWQDIVGSPLLNNALAQILANKVDLDVFQETANQVNINTATLENHGYRINTLEDSQNRQDLEIGDLQQSTKKLQEDIQFKVDLFRGEVSIYNGANGTDYVFGDVIDTYPEGSGQFVMVTSVDENGSVVSAQYMPNVAEPDVGHIIIANGGADYSIDDIIPVKSYSITVKGAGYKEGDIIQSASGHYYKVINTDGSGGIENLLPTQIQDVDTQGYGFEIDDSTDSTEIYAQVISVDEFGAITEAVVAEGPNISDTATIVGDGSGAELFYTYGTGAQLTFQGFNTIMFRYNTVEPVNAGDPPKGIIYSIAGGAAGTWKSMTENIPFANLIDIKAEIDYTYNTLTVTNPDSGELLPYAYGYNIGDEITLKGINGLKVTITDVDDNGTPKSFTPESFYANEVLSGIYSTSVVSDSWFNSVIVNGPGSGYKVGDTFTLDNLDGSPTFTVLSVDGNGGIQAVQPSSFTTSKDVSGPYYTHATGSQSAAIIYVSSSSGNAAYGLRFKVNSVPKTTNVEFNEFIDDLIKALRGDWISDVEEYNFVLNERIDKKADQETLDQHLGDFSNPHNVDKTQVGLDAVDNTSDMDKPVSTAAQLKFDAIETELLYYPKIHAISRTGYNILNENILFDSSAYYFVSRGNPPYSVNFAVYSGGTGYQVGDTLTLVGSYSPDFEASVTAVDPTGAVTGFTITNLLDQVDFDISGLYQTFTTEAGSGCSILINCSVIDESLAG